MQKMNVFAVQGLFATVVFIGAAKPCAVLSPSEVSVSFYIALDFIIVHLLWQCTEISVRSTIINQVHNAHFCLYRFSTNSHGAEDLYTVS